MSSTQRSNVLQQLDRLFSDGTLAGIGDGELLDRFRTRRDEAAFEALVELHGPMVLGLCRRFLRDPRDIEDAFQATFLVFVRKAPAIRDGGLLSNWLYGVALRVATRARTNLLRRRGREHSLGAAEFAAASDEGKPQSLGPVLDQELSRLPAKYRAPLVLCYLRGRTHDQAASELSCPVGTVRSRMARGRDLLRRRLIRRGCAPNAALLGLPSAELSHLLTAALPERLVAATVEAALNLGSTNAIQAGSALGPVLALTQGVVTPMHVAQFKWIGLCVLATGLSAGGAVVVAAVAVQSSGAPGESRVTSVTSSEPSQQGSTGTASTSTSTVSSKRSKTTEERLRALEDQVDRIFRASGIARDSGGPGISEDAPVLDRLEAKVRFLSSKHDATSIGTGTSSSAAPTTATIASTGTASSSSRGVSVSSPKTGSTASSAPSRSAASTSIKSTRNVEDALLPDSPASSTRIRELEAQLKTQMLETGNVVKLHRQNVVSEQEVQLYQSRIDLTLATLKGMQDDFADELEQAKLAMKRTKAELDGAFAQQQMATVSVERNNRINSRKAGIVSDEDVARAEAELRSAEANVRIKQVDVETVSLRCQKLERWRSRIDEILASHAKVQ